MSTVARRRFSHFAIDESAHTVVLLGGELVYWDDISSAQLWVEDWACIGTKARFGGPSADRHDRVQAIAGPRTHDRDDVAIVARLDPLDHNTGR